MKYLFTLWLALLCLPLFSQLSTAARYAATIDSQTLKTHVYALAADEFAGRETGTEGNLKAAAYIADQFKAYGISTVPGDTDHFQDVAFTTVKWQDINLLINGAQVEHLRDFLSIPQYFPVQDIDQKEISSLTFIGYGIDDAAYSDYRGKKFRGKHLLVYGGEPRDTKGSFRISGTDTPSVWSGDDELELKILAAKKAGAASIWIIEDQFRDKVLDARRTSFSGAMLMGLPDEITAAYLPHAMITPQIAEQISGEKRTKIIKLRDRITTKGKPGCTKVPVDMDWKTTHQVSSTTGVNVLGYIEGTDPALKDEIIIVTAHFDHLGMRGNDIFYGADDNASGTAAVLEIAEAMMLAKTNNEGPKRSVLCMLVTGEEKGLLGSQYYAENPVFPLQQTVANVNIDMIGRMDTLHKQPYYTYVIGADRLSTELHDINESVNLTYTQLELDYKYNDDDDPNKFYYRSDHYNFAKNGIPSVFYFSGVHEDYHRITDTPDKVMYGKAERIARLAFHTAWELANRKDRIKVNVTGRS